MPKIIVIDSYIGQYGYSKQYVRNMLNDAGDEQVEMQISSLGGSVDHAIAIHDMFAQRGKVSVTMNGFIASAATFIALPCPTRISENSFYLIHKVLSWVDVFGSMNEDNIESVIEELTKVKNENAKMTLTLAARYAERAAQKGKTLQDVLNLMKEDTWLTAEEALEWGFVDEVYKPTVTQSNTSILDMAAMINAAGLPDIPAVRNQRSEVGSQKSVGADLQSMPPATAAKDYPLGPTGISGHDGIPGWPGILDTAGADLQSVPTAPATNSQKPIANSQSSNPEIMNKSLELQHVNEVLNIAELVITEEGSFLNEEQLIAIDTALELSTDAIAERDTLTTQLNAVTAERDNSITAFETQSAELTAANEQLAAITAERDQRTAEVTALNEQLAAITAERDSFRESDTAKAQRLAKLPAARAILLQASEDPNLTAKGVDWNTIDNLPHNKFVDNNN
jgi:ATP-dependent protease ClpP protease subunit